MSSHSDLVRSSMFVRVSSIRSSTLALIWLKPSMSVVLGGTTQPISSWPVAVQGAASKISLPTLLHTRPLQSIRRACMNARSRAACIRLPRPRRPASMPGCMSEGTPTAPGLLPPVLTWLRQRGLLDAPYWEGALGRASSQRFLLGLELP